MIDANEELDREQYVDDFISEIMQSAIPEKQNRPNNSKSSEEICREVIEIYNSFTSENEYMTYAILTVLQQKYVSELAKGMNRKEIAEKYYTDVQNVQAVINNAYIELKQFKDNIYGPLEEFCKTSRLLKCKNNSDRIRETASMILTKTQAEDICSTLDGLKQYEIAERSGREKSTVSRTIERAKTRLRSYMVPIK